MSSANGGGACLRLLRERRHFYGRTRFQRGERKLRTCWRSKAIPDFLIFGDLYTVVLPQAL